LKFIKLVRKYILRTNNRRFRNARLWSNEILKDLAPKFTGDIINVSAWRDADKNNKFYGTDYFINSTSYSISNWYSSNHGYEGDENNYLINLEEEIKDSKLIKKWDVVFTHTVLEHIFNTQLALKSLCRLARQYVIVVVPFLQEDHTDYGDFWRFTPRGLKRLFEENNYKLVFISANDNNKNAIYIVAVAENIDKEKDYPKIKFNDMKSNFVEEVENIRLGRKFFE